MADLSLSDAGETLRDFFGPYLSASRGDGADRMADALVERKHISKDEAKKIVQDLIDAGSVVFRTGKRPDDASVDPSAAGVQVGAEGLPVGTGVILPDNEGYWQFK